MTSKLKGPIVASILILCCASASAAGFRQLTVVDSGYRDLSVGLWYPAQESPPSEPNTEFGLAVNHAAPIGVTNRGLVLISHGYGGWYAGHANTAVALADAGFVVAAPSHTGNTWFDMSAPVQRWALDRPRHISRVIDYLLRDEEVSAAIDPDKIAVYGFSAGGYTALGLIGAVPDLEQGQRFCQQNPSEFVCRQGLLDAMLHAEMQNLAFDAWGSDARIKAAAIAAPALGFAYSAKSLAQVRADVQLWSGELDDQVPTATNAVLLAERLPQRPETHWVPRAGHFAFLLLPCNENLKQNDPDEYQMICSDLESFDRNAFHQFLQVELARFFVTSLGITE